MPAAEMEKEQYPPGLPRVCPRVLYWSDTIPLYVLHAEVRCTKGDGDGHPSLCRDRDREIATVYRLLDGSLHHARCGRRLMVQGCSTEELHCYCLTCAESVWLPLCVLVRPAGADSTIGPPWG
ncbi:MAG: hypothetical protein AUH69_04675 [Actinobacteria bacterium 13_1_40CM_4_65_12]|nr:MAG: hypothetical protein AUH69_04675 [Actinobacteria bacterium 13_1_40CM_4_65_12]